MDWQSEDRKRLLQIDLNEQPQDGYICYLEGIALLNQNKYEDSAAFFELARQAFAGGRLYVPHMYRCLGVCLMSLGRNEEAEAVLNDGFWLFPFYTDLLVLRAELFRRLDRNEEALKDLQTCLAFRNGPNFSVPTPEIGIEAIEEMLADILAILPG